MKAGVAFRLFASAFVCAALAIPVRAQDEPAKEPPQESAAEQQIATIPGDWAPELLYGMWNSPNPEASRALYRAAFSAGQVLVPELESALKDDRTAEFAAQSMAFIGGRRAFEDLIKLADDKRELGLRRFVYGALGEIDTPAASEALIGAIAGSDDQPDRTITEAAILALTVRSDVALIPKMREAAKQVHDPVIRDDVQNAIDVIQVRAKYLATPQGENPDYSIDRAVRTYFIPALEPPPAPKTSGAAGARLPELKPPPITVKVEDLAFSPDQNRALAHVSFETPDAVAQYDMVLQKQLGNWVLVSVWLGPEREKTPPGGSK